MREIERAEIQLRHEGIEEAHWAVGGDVVVEHLREEHHLGAIAAGDIGMSEVPKKRGALAKTRDVQYMKGQEFSLHTGSTWTCRALTFSKEVVELCT